MFDLRTVIRIVLLIIILFMMIGPVRKGQYLLIIGLSLIFLGLLLDNIVTFANNNTMPVEISNGEIISVEYDLLYKHAKMTEDTKIWFLADIFNIAIYMRLFEDEIIFGCMVSIGDLITVPGIIFLIISLFKYPVEKKKKAAMSP